jgi:hypothetical protein
VCAEGDDRERDEGRGPWNPSATRVSNRTFVFVDSMSAWERPVSRATSIAARWVTMRRCSCNSSEPENKAGALADPPKTTHGNSRRASYGPAGTSTVIEMG